MLADQVKAGKLPPVAQRLPKSPKVANDMPASLLKTEVGKYGGTIRTLTVYMEVITGFIHQQRVNRNEKQTHSKITPV
jgi:hypothetical protein